MPHEEQNEWPSFETVLRDIAPDSPTARALATAARRERFSPYDVTPSLVTAPLVEELSTISEEDRVGEQDVDEQMVVTLDDAASERSSSILPEPLAPLEIDTSNIRSLLEPRASESFDTGTILEGLTPIEVLAPLPPIDFDLPVGREIDLEVGSHADVEGSTLEQFESLHEELSSVDFDAAIEEPEDLDEGLDLDAEIDRVEAAFDVSSIADTPFGKSLHLDNHFETTAFDGISFDLSEPAWMADSANPVLDEGPHDAEHELIDHADLVDEVQPVDVEKLDVEKLEPFDFSAYASETPGIELPDVNASSVEVFEDLGTLTELDFGGTRSDADFDDIVGFDSIAAADEIETHLDELTGLRDEEPNNVVPLRPDVLPVTNTSDAVEGPELHEHTGWVGLKEVHKRDDRRKTTPDPWEYMRPADGKKETGFWATRPKFFGGGERKRKKAERRAESNIPVQQAVDVTFDHTCPNCGSDCQVDLDDPIGRRMHVSCPECKHMWHTPYLVDEVDEKTG